MSDEKLGKTFYYMQWKDGIPTTFVSSPFVKIKKDNCFEILPVDLVGLLKAEREKSKKLVEALSWALDSVCKHEGDSHQDTNRTWCLYCQSWVYKSDIENLKKAEAILKEYEKEGAE